MEIKDVKFIKSVVEFEKEENPLDIKIGRKRIFFLGRSNVGKSSLINSLLGVKELAFSGAKAGKTRTINIFEVNKKYECMDFPGYGYALGDKENRLKLRDMILDYLQNNTFLNLKIILIVDAFVGPTDLDREIYDYIIEKGAQILVILNKVDKANQKELDKSVKKAIEFFPKVRHIFYSSKNLKYRERALFEIFED